MQKILFTLLVFVSISFHPPEIKWVAIGDSITYLNDHKNETGNRITAGYMTRVTEKLPWIHFVNQGHNGWTSGQIAAQFDKIGIEKADLYSIFLGTNDWWGSRPLGTFEDYKNDSGNASVYGSFRIIFNKLHALNKDARIILITPMQRGDFVYINGAKNNAFGSYREKNGQSLSQFANAIKTIGKFEHCTVVDLYNRKDMSVKKMVRFKRLKDPVTSEYKNFSYPRYTEVPFDPEKDEYPYPLDAVDVTYDGLHPSDKGYEIIAKLLIKALRQ